MLALQNRKFRKTRLILFSYSHTTTTVKVESKVQRSIKEA